MKKRTIIEAAIEVLKREGRPLHVKEIYNKILEYDFYRFRAEFPESIVRVQIRRHCDGVDFPTAHPQKYFQILNDGTYWLHGKPIQGQQSQSQKNIFRIKNVLTHELKDLQVKYADNFRETILNQLKKIDPYQFETFSKKLLEIYGFIEMQVTRKSRDGGLDGFGKLKVGITHLNVAFQSKRWKNNNIPRTEVDKFRGAIQGEYEQGIIFTTSKFSLEALQASTKKGAVPIILIDGSKIVEIMIEKKFGVEVEYLPLYMNALDVVLNEN